MAAMGVVPMSSPSKKKGTGGENEAVTWLRRLWPSAERRALRGIRDAGDVAGTPFVVEVKRCERWEPNKWLIELERERQWLDEGPEPGFVMARRNHGKWTFFVPEDVMEALLIAYEKVVTSA